MEEKREPNPTMDAIYILSPQPHIVECLLADFEQRRYRKAYLVWVSELHRAQEGKLQNYRTQIAGTNPNFGFRINSSCLAGFYTLPLEFFPRESHLITFRDPWSFPILYHPDCNDVVAEHMRSLAKKVGVQIPSPSCGNSDFKSV